jgi:hypothetical protein
MYVIANHLQYVNIQLPMVNDWLCYIPVHSYNLPYSSDMINIQIITDHLCYISFTLDSLVI